MCLAKNAPRDLLSELCCSFLLLVDFPNNPALGFRLLVVGFLGGGFKCFLFSPLLGEMIQFD